MSKSLSNSNLPERSNVRPLLAIFLCTSMAAFGCTTDRNLGNGDPVVTPGVRSTPTGGTSAGSESEPVPPPMMSSFSNGSHPRRLTADQAAAIMAQQQQPRVRVLGPASPDNGGRPYASDRMMLGSQQQYSTASSVNSTIYSAPTAVITSGAGEAVATGDAAANFLDTTVAIGNSGSSVIAGSSTVTGTTVNGGTLTNAAGPVITPTGSTVTPTSSAVSTPAAFASVRTLSPTAAAVVNPPASISGSPAIATTSSARTAGTTATTNRTATTNTTATTANASTNVSVANPVRVMNSNGRVTITNSATTTGTTRQQ